MEKKVSPGIARSDRISDTGLLRLEKQLQSGAKMSRLVLAQWIKRYGEAARDIIRKHGGDSVLQDRQQ